MNATDLLTVTVIAVLAVMSPGPDTIIVTRNSLLYSKRVGLFTAIGIALGNTIWVGASLAGISIMIAKTVLLFNIIKYIGAAYLIYIGLQAFTTKKTECDSKAETISADDSVVSIGVKKIKSGMTPKQAFRLGLLTNMLNPKCALFFVSFFGIIITPATPISWRCFYGFEISLIALMWFSILATVLSFSKVKFVFERFSKWFSRTTGAILIMLGVKLALYHQK